ncbi:MAG: metallophosphoesterase [Candidatus Nanopelagicales bacterium]
MKPLDDDEPGAAAEESQAGLDLVTESSQDDDAQDKTARTITWKRWLGMGITLVLIVIAILLLLRACAKEVPESVTVVAAGDMACDAKDPAMKKKNRDMNQCRFKEVSDIAVSLQPDALLGLGDYQYEVPKAEAYQDIYGPTWGRLRSITLPAIGNQELKVFEANTFRQYFGERAGPPEGYWSTELGRWHVVVLNSNCTVVIGGCGEGSPQQIWLTEDLAANDSKCTLAIMHHPRWSTGIAGPDGRTDALYRTLDQGGVDILLSGHEADYERFGQLDADGNPSMEGVRQFVVGTGGQAVYRPEQGAAPWRNKGVLIESEYADFEHHGVLELQLDPDRYSWAFHSLDTKKPITDSGSSPCR